MLSEICPFHVIYTERPSALKAAEETNEIMPFGRELAHWSTRRWILARCVNLSERVSTNVGMIFQFNQTRTKHFRILFCAFRLQAMGMFAALSKAQPWVGWVFTRKNPKSKYSERKFNRIGLVHGWMYDFLVEVIAWPRNLIENNKRISKGRNPIIVSVLHWFIPYVNGSIRQQAQFLSQRSVSDRFSPKITWPLSKNSQDFGSSAITESPSRKHTHAHDTISVEIDEKTGWTKRGRTATTHHQHPICNWRADRSAGGCFEFALLPNPGSSIDDK